MTEPRIPFWERALDERSPAVRVWEGAAPGAPPTGAALWWPAPSTPTPWSCCCTVSPPPADVVCRALVGPRVAPIQVQRVTVTPSAPPGTTPHRFQNSAAVSPLAEKVLLPGVGNHLLRRRSCSDWRLGLGGPGCWSWSGLPVRLCAGWALPSAKGCSTWAPGSSLSADAVVLVFLVRSAPPSLPLPANRHPLTWGSVASPPRTLIRQERAPIARTGTELRKWLNCHPSPFSPTIVVDKNHSLLDLVLGHASLVGAPQALVVAALLCG